MFPSVIVFCGYLRWHIKVPAVIVPNHTGKSQKKSYRFDSLDRRSSRAKLPHHFRFLGLIEIQSAERFWPLFLRYGFFMRIFPQEKHTEIGWVAIVACRWLTFWCGLLSLQARYSIQVLLVAHPKRDSLLRWAYETSLLHQLVAVDFNCLAIWALD